MHVNLIYLGIHVFMYEYWNSAYSLKRSVDIKKYSIYILKILNITVCLCLGWQIKPLQENACQIKAFQKLYN